MKLTIITINLNNKDGLRKTIESVISQTFVDYEFIVIDGGSTKGDVEVIKEYGDKISYWISEPDKGIYNAMNKGIVKAKGEYIHFLNSGDLLASETVYADLFEGDSHESFICGNFYLEKGGILEKFDSYKDMLWNHCLYDLYSGNVCHQAFIIRTDNFAKYGLYDETKRITADWKLFFEAIGLNQESVLYRDIYTVIYNMEGLSSTIGGAIIWEEKKDVFAALLSPAINKKYSRRYTLEMNAYITDAVLDNNWFHWAFRAFLKIGRKIGILKS